MFNVETNNRHYHAILKSTLHKVKQNDL